MTRSRLWSKDIGIAFPKGAPLARLMWALVGIRGDLMLEYRSTSKDERHGDGQDAQFFGRMYFFRGTVRRMYSLLQVLRRVGGDPEFQELLARNDLLRKAYFEAKKWVDHEAKSIDALRNGFAAHAEHYANTLENYLALKLACFVVQSGLLKESGRHRGGVQPGSSTPAASCDGCGAGDRSRLGAVLDPS